LWKTKKNKKKHNEFNETTTMKSDSGREYGRKRIGIFGSGGDAEYAEPISSPLPLVPLHHMTLGPVKHVP